MLNKRRPRKERKERERKKKNRRWQKLLRGWRRWVASLAYYITCTVWIALGAANVCGSLAAIWPLNSFSLSDEHQRLAIATA